MDENEGSERFDKSGSAPSVVNDCGVETRSFLQRQKHAVEDVPSVGHLSEDTEQKVAADLCHDGDMQQGQHQLFGDGNATSRVLPKSTDQWFHIMQLQLLEKQEQEELAQRKKEQTHAYKQQQQLESHTGQFGLEHDADPHAAWSPASHAASSCQRSGGVYPPSTSNTPDKLHQRGCSKLHASPDAFHTLQTANVPHADDEVTEVWHSTRDRCNLFDVPVQRPYTAPTHMLGDKYEDIRLQDAQLGHPWFMRDTAPEMLRSLTPHSMHVTQVAADPRSGIGGSSTHCATHRTNQDTNNTDCASPPTALAPRTHQPPSTPDVIAEQRLRWKAEPHPSATALSDEARLGETPDCFEEEKCRIVREKEEMMRKCRLLEEELFDSTTANTAKSPGRRLRDQDDGQSSIGEYSPSFDGREGSHMSFEQGSPRGSTLLHSESRRDLLPSMMAETADVEVSETANMSSLQYPYISQLEHGNEGRQPTAHRVDGQLAGVMASSKRFWQEGSFEDTLKASTTTTSALAGSLQADAMQPQLVQELLARARKALAATAQQQMETTTSAAALAATAQLNSEPTTSAASPASRTKSVHSWQPPSPEPDKTDCSRELLWSPSLSLSVSPAEGSLEAVPSFGSGIIAPAAVSQSADQSAGKRWDFSLQESPATNLSKKLTTELEGREASSMMGSPAAPSSTTELLGHDTMLDLQTTRQCQVMFPAPAPVLGGRATGRIGSPVQIGHGFLGRSNGVQGTASPRGSPEQTSGACAAPSNQVFAPPGVPSLP